MIMDRSVGSANSCPAMTRMEQATATGAFELAAALVRRWHRPGRVSVLAALAARAGMPFGYGLPLPVVPARLIDSLDREKRHLS